jgi:hypothetical protein
MSTARVVRTLACAVLVVGGAVPPAYSASGTPAVLIRNATVHTMTSRGTLRGADVLVSDGRIAAVGTNLRAPAGAEVVDAAGRAVTPGLFAGLSSLGLEETGMVPSASDEALNLGKMRPEFDVTLAYNPDSVSVGVNRVAGMTFGLIGPVAQAGSGSRPGGSVIAGQGGVVTLDGATEPLARALFVELGGENAALSGGSRAAHYMLIHQALVEARTPNMMLMHDDRLLTPLGRQVLLDYLKDGRPLVVKIDRASDIRQLLAFAKREQLPNVVITGGAEAWRVAPELAAAKVPVIVDPLANLPENFDLVAATLENAARLQAAGVRVGFSLTSPEPHNVRKLRQAAGIAVANGMPWDAALAAITRVPAEALGVGDRAGSIDVGRPADLVLWSGDPLEVTSWAERVWIGGRAQPERSRQTELRDRYLEKLKKGEAR